MGNRYVCIITVTGHTIQVKDPEGDIFDAVLDAILGDSPIVWLSYEFGNSKQFLVTSTIVDVEAFWSPAL